MRLTPKEKPLSVRSHCGLNPSPVKGLRESSRTLDWFGLQPQKLASMNRKRVKTGGESHDRHFRFQAAALAQSEPEIVGSTSTFRRRFL